MHYRDGGSHSALQARTRLVVSNNAIKKYVMVIIREVGKRFWAILSVGLAVLAVSIPAMSAEPASASADDAGVLYVEDLIYGRVLGAGLLADIAYPKYSEEKIPAILSMHGGRWSRGTKRDNGAIDVKEWAGRGFVAMTVDYRLRACSPPPACYQDVQCAIRFLHANAEKYHIDEDRIFVIGQSAGGHMAALAATLGNGEFPRTGGWEEARDDIRGAICISGPHDLLTCPWGNLWTPNNIDPMIAQEYASPIRHVSDMMRPLVIFHADNDKSVPIDNALSMVEVLKAKNAPYVFHHYTTAGHMNPTPEVVEKSLEFISSVSADPKTRFHFKSVTPVQ